MSIAEKEVVASSEEKVLLSQFEAFGLHGSLLKGIFDQGIKKPTPVQTKTIKYAMTGGDVRVAAPTGTGKTLAYIAPVVQYLLENKTHKLKIRSLILAPTRELALQIHERVKQYTKFTNIKSASVCGGMRISSQINRLRRKTDILIATPGRLLDLVEQNALDLSDVSILILDEADRMLDMGFIPDVNKIFSLPRSLEQRMMFSATFNQQIQKIADKLLKHPAVINVAKVNSIPKNVTQIIHPVAVSEKIDLLINLISNKNWMQSIVFSKTKKGADDLAYKLNKQNINAKAIHGDLPQGKRNRVLEAFRENKTQVLVATDVAARGLDIRSLDSVINFDLPRDAEDYVHRIGRTGRAGAGGEAVTLVTNQDKRNWQRIAKDLNLSLSFSFLEGFGRDFSANIVDKKAKKSFGKFRKSSKPRQQKDLRENKNISKPRQKKDLRENKKSSKPRQQKDLRENKKGLKFFNKSKKTKI